MNQEDPSKETVELKRKRKKLTWIFWLFFLALALCGYWIWFVLLKDMAYTDDAYVEGNQIYITPLVDGFITAIHTDDTFLVKKGQLLIELDTTDASIALETAKKRLADNVREVCQAFHQTFASHAEAVTRKAELIRTAQDVKHRSDVLSVSGVSLEEYEHAVAALRSSYFLLKNAESNFEKALAYIQGTSIKHHPKVQASADVLRASWVQFYRCKISAPHEGLAAQRKAQVGMWVKKGEPLLSIIPLDQIWVNANFKETQMKHMQIGQSVKITSDLYGDDVVFHGEIVGLPGAAGNAFSLLPPQNLSGNWIKIVQRLPVRIALDPEELKKHPLRVGLSMEAVVDLSKQDGLLVPTSSADSPLYETTIFQKEEEGNRELIDSIIKGNLDPRLLPYAEMPFFLQSPSLDKDIDEYLPLIESVL